MKIMVVVRSSFEGKTSSFFKLFSIKWHRFIAFLKFSILTEIFSFIQNRLNMSQYNEMIDKCKSSLHSSICCFMSDVSSTSIFSDITHLSGVFSTNYFYLSHTITLLLVFWNVTLQKQCLLIKQSFTH